MFINPNKKTSKTNNLIIEIQRFKRIEKEITLETKTTHKNGPKMAQNKYHSLSNVHISSLLNRFLV